MLLIVAVAFAAMSCGNKCCDKKCCQDTCCLLSRLQSNRSCCFKKEATLLGRFLFFNRESNSFRSSLSAVRCLRCGKAKERHLQEYHSLRARSCVPYLHIQTERG